MKIRHRLIYNTLELRNLEKELEKRLIEFNIPYDKTPLPNQNEHIVAFEIEEDHPLWSYFAELVEKQQFSDFYDTIFSQEEIFEAQWSRLIPLFERGYPQPQGTWVTNPPTYSGKCRCGIYDEQIQPFRIKGEPKMGKNHFMSLYWSYPLFALNDVVGKIEANGMDISTVPVHVDSKLTVSRIIKQIVAARPFPAKMSDLNELKKSVCSICGSEKYLPHKRGYMIFEQTLLDDRFIYHSSEWFGDGGSAFQEFIIPKKLAVLVLENQWKGVRLKPLEFLR